MLGCCCGIPAETEQRGPQTECRTSPFFANRDLQSETAKPPPNADIACAPCSYNTQPLHKQGDFMPFGAASLLTVAGQLADTPGPILILRKRHNREFAFMALGVMKGIHNRQMGAVDSADAANAAIFLSQTFQRRQRRSSRHAIIRLVRSWDLFRQSTSFLRRRAPARS
jgi:hypothetical protein